MWSVRIKKSGEYIFFDCSEQTPSGRVSLCFDDEAVALRKEHKPKGSAMGMAAVTTASSSGAPARSRITQREVFGV